MQHLNFVVSCELSLCFLFLMFQKADVSEDICNHQEIKESFGK